MTEETERIALEVLAKISQTPMTWAEICEEWGLTRYQWQVTVRPAVRQFARNLGLRVPRPVPDDFYKYRATDLWNGNDDDEEPHIREGYLFRLQDEYTRRCHSLDLLETSLSKMDGRSLVARRLKRVMDQERACMASMEGAAEAAGIDLHSPVLAG